MNDEQIADEVRRTLFAVAAIGTATETLRACLRADDATDDEKAEARRVLIEHGFDPDT